MSLYLGMKFNWPPDNIAEMSKLRKTATMRHTQYRKLNKTISTVGC